MSTKLIITVGSSPLPVIVSILALKPSVVQFVYTLYIIHLYKFKKNTGRAMTPCVFLANLISGVKGPSVVWRLIKNLLLLLLFWKVFSSGYGHEMAFSV
jgi:hypothetical protein